MAHWSARGGAGVSATPGIAFGPSSRGLVMRRHPVARQASVAGRDSFYRGGARSPLGIGRGPCRVHLPRDGIVRPEGLNRISLKNLGLMSNFNGANCSAPSHLHSPVPFKIHQSIKRMLTWAGSLVVFPFL